MQRNPWTWTLALLAACSFDGSGQGEGGPTDPPAGTTGGSSGVMTAADSSGGPEVTTGGGGMSGTSGSPGETTADPVTGPDETTGPVMTLPPDVTTGDGETTTGDGTTTTDPSTTTGMTTDSTTGGNNPCPGPIVKILRKVEDADIEWPMVEEMSGQGEGRIASSPTAEFGTVEFSVDIPCVDNFAVWGRVYDGDPGIHQSYDPDSYYVKVDGGPEIEWFYGCQTEGDPAGWAWQRTRGVNGDTCGDQYDWTLPLGPGTHYIKFRNKESQTGGGTRAAIARIFVTNDPAYVPSAE